MAEEEILSGPAMQARKFKETDEERIFYRDRAAMQELYSLKTVFNGYDKKEVRKYLQKILDDRTNQEKAENKIIDDLRKQISTLQKDTNESVEKYNKLLLSKISGTDTGSESSDEELARIKKENDKSQQKILSLSDELHTMEEEKEKAAVQIEDLNATIESLKSSCAENTVFADARNLLLNQISDLRNQLSSLQDSNNDLKSKLQEANADKDNAVNSLKDLTAKCEDTKQKLDSAEANYRKTTDADAEKIADLQKQVNLLSAKNQELSDQSEFADDVKEALLRTAASEKEAVQAKTMAESQVRALSLKKDALENENKQIRNALARMQATIDEDKSYAARLEEELNNVYSAQLGEESETARNAKAEADTSAEEEYVAMQLDA